MNCETLQGTDRQVQEQLQGWGRRTARHYQQKSDEVKELLIVMAQMAESVGARDQRCAGQINEVTARLTAIASLDNLTEIRSSIEKSAAELKTSITRMTAEGKAAIDRLREQVSTYRTKLDEAERIASRDALTGLRNRLCVESLIERKIGVGVALCVAIADIDGFKNVNDKHGHLIGDELLKQFATELVSACRSTDVIGRWGGDEFIIMFECGFPDASAQTDRLRKWVCGNYTVSEKSGAQKLKVDASIGLAEHMPGETMKDLLARADAAMYEQKAASKKNRSALKQ
jgi:diguanylate cyclase (GGDEF)-like protein